MFVECITKRFTQFENRYFFCFSLCAGVCDVFCHRLYFREIAGTISLPVKTTEFFFSSRSTRQRALTRGTAFYESANKF